MTMMIDNGIWGASFQGNPNGWCYPSFEATRHATFILRMHPVLNLLCNVIPRDDRCVTALFDRQEDISHYFWPDYIDVYYVWCLDPHISWFNWWFFHVYPQSWYDLQSGRMVSCMSPLYPIHPLPERPYKIHGCLYLSQFFTQKRVGSQVVKPGWVKSPYETCNGTPHDGRVDPLCFTIDNIPLTAHMLLAKSESWLSYVHISMFIPLLYPFASLVTIN